MSTTPSTQTRSGEQGIAMVIALLMMLAMSVIGTSLMFVSKTETLSSHNYRLMSQARYGAESGIHVAANYLLSSTYGGVMPGTGGDAGSLDTATGVTTFTNYDITKSPVTTKSNGKPVVLAPVAANSNYPVQSVKDAFAALFTNASLDVSDAPVKYAATATLKSMRAIDDSFTGNTVVIQTWEIVGDGTISGAKNATVEVSSVVERQTAPIYAYAAFSTDPGCASMTFGGGGSTNSFDHRNALGADGKPVTNNAAGDVGTNGNLTAGGSNNTVINGSLSTPRTGVGACTTSNVTAETINGQATVTAGLVQLSQNVEYPTPALPATLPPVGTDVKFQGSCPAVVTSGCTMLSNVPGVTGSVPVLDPSTQPGGVMTLSEVNTNATSVLVLKGGDYTFNSLTMNGNSRIVVYPGSGDVRINIIGTSVTTPLTITGQGLVNTSYDPTQLQFIYAGTGGVKLAGGDNTAALIYAPNASGAFSGGSDLYGAVVVKTLTDLGGAAIHYDIALKNDALTAGKYMLSAFTWKSY